MLKTIIALITILSAAFGAYFFIDKTYAKCDRVRIAEIQIQQHLEIEDMRGNQQRLWDLEKKCRVSCTNKEEMEILELRETIEMQKEKLKNIMKDYYNERG